jgi:hypothetical protein
MHVTHNPRRCLDLGLTGASYPDGKPIRNTANGFVKEACMTGAKSAKQLMYPRLKFNRFGTGDHTLAMHGNMFVPVDAAKGRVEVELCNFRASFIEDLSAFCF